MPILLIFLAIHIFLAFLLFLFFSGMAGVQQGEAKKALEVLQKPAVPVDLQVYLKLHDLKYGLFSQT